jgi:Zn-finger protein
MTEADDAASRDEQTRNSDGEFDPEKFEDIGCPECGGEWYYEPHLRYGTRYEATSGWACMNCSWSKIDPNSGDTYPHGRTRAEAKSEAQQIVEQLNEFDMRCDECGATDVELGRRVRTDDDGEYLLDDEGDFQVVQVIECSDCFTALVTDPVGEYHERIVVDE